MRRCDGAGRRHTPNRGWRLQSVSVRCSEPNVTQNEAEILLVCYDFFQCFFFFLIQGISVSCASLQIGVMRALALNWPSCTRLKWRDKARCKSPTSRKSSFGFLVQTQSAGFSCSRITSSPRKITLKAHTYASSNTRRFRDVTPCLFVFFLCDTFQ